MDQKKDGDDLFDRLNTAILNQYLNSLMDGLTAKVISFLQALLILFNLLIYIFPFFPIRGVECKGGTTNDTPLPAGRRGITI